MNLYLNLFINPPPMPVRSALTCVITLVPLLAGNADGVKKIFHVASLYHSRRGKITVKEHQCEGVITAVLLLLSYYVSLLPGPTASIHPYVNVTMLPQGPHHIHLLVELSEHLHRSASIQCHGCSTHK